MFGKNSKEKDKIASYQACFNSEDGKRVLYDLMRTHNMLSSSFSENYLDMARKEGERNVILRILHILRIDPQDLVKKIDDLTDHEKLYLEE